jgi:hypothetical protein
MNVKGFLTLAALFYAFYGLGLLIAPGPFLAVYEVTLDADGELIARLLGAALLGFTFIFWQLRNSRAEVLTRVLQGSFIYCAAGLVLAFAAVISGVAGPISWAVITLYAFLAAGFGYYGFVKP